MGDVEITKFASLYPERVVKVIHMKSGYDWSDPAFLKEFVVTAGAVGPDASGMKSLDVFRGW